MTMLAIAGVESPASSSPFVRRRERLCPSACRSAVNCFRPSRGRLDNPTSRSVFGTDKRFPCGCKRPPPIHDRCRHIGRPPLGSSNRATFPRQIRTASSVPLVRKSPTANQKRYDCGQEMEAKLGRLATILEARWRSEKARQCAFIGKKTEMIGAVRRLRRLALATWNMGFRVAKRWSPSNSVTSCPPGLRRACIGRYSLTATVAAVSDTELRMVKPKRRCARTHQELLQLQQVSQRALCYRFQV